MAEETHSEIQRFTSWQVIQHLLWAAAFTTLLVTGLALKFPENFLSKAIINLMGWNSRAILHRIAALLFIVVGVAHIIYYTIIDHSVPLLQRAILLRKKDLDDIILDIKYHLRLTKEKPKFGRYTWIEKFDYWAGAAGSGIILVTGIAMWFSYGSVIAGLQSLTFLGGLPLNIYNWARMIHGYEAILAGSVIVILHMYMAVWRPGTFPIAKQIWTGKMPKHHYEEEHPLELAEIEAKMPR